MSQVHFSFPSSLCFIHSLSKSTYMSTRRKCSILLLKERTETADPISLEQPKDPYETAFRAAFANDEHEHEHDHSLDIELSYLAPLAVLTKEHSILSQSVAAGLPPSLSTDGPNSGRQGDNTAKRSLWAFVVTSRNAVRAVVQALEGQSDLGMESRQVSRYYSFLQMSRK